MTRLSESVVAHFLTKDAQIFGDFWANLKRITVALKLLGYFLGINLGKLGGLYSNIWLHWS